MSNSSSIPKLRNESQKMVLNVDINHNRITSSPKIITEKKFADGIEQVITSETCSGIEDMFQVLGEYILSVVVSFVRNEISNLFSISKKVFDSLNKCKLLYKEYCISMNNICEDQVGSNLIYQIDHKNKIIRINVGELENFRPLSKIMFDLRNIPSVSIYQGNNQLFDISKHVSLNQMRFLRLSLARNDLRLRMELSNELYGIDISLFSYKYDSSLVGRIFASIRNFDNIYFVKFVTYNPRLLEDFHNIITMKCKNLLYIWYILKKSNSPDITRLKVTTFRDPHVLVFPRNVNICRLKCSDSTNQYFKFDVSQIYKLCFLRVANIGYEYFIHRVNQKIGTG